MLFWKLITPEEATVRALMPPVPKPARRVPSLTMTALAPLFQLLEPEMTTVPAPVLVKSPVLELLMPPEMVRTPVELTASMVPPEEPMVRTRLEVRSKALEPE